MNTTDWYKKTLADQKAMGFPDNRTVNDIKNYLDNTPYRLRGYNHGGYNDDSGRTRNFSALNLSPVEKRNIIDQSYIRNNLPVPNRSYSSLGSQMNAMNLPMPSGSATGQKTTGSPPNWKDNLLNYALSPKGRGMA
ncbi:MAG TPA: hypothetical protein DCM10_02965, partial [Xanthomarina gelatinilytica]|nr:hypothetical protein [Xanthomarina gelatinilytica]